jgi:type IV pilus assembly protein PilE
MNTLTEAPVKHTGFSLVELMVAIAIISVLVAIAIPAYNGYITEARLATARSNIDSLRLFLEDYRLDNGTYVGDSGDASRDNLAEIQADFGWNPRQDSSGYSYRMTNITATTYDIHVSFGGAELMRCDETNSCT